MAGWLDLLREATIDQIHTLHFQGQTTVQKNKMSSEHKFHIFIFFHVFPLLYKKLIRKNQSIKNNIKFWAVASFGKLHRIHSTVHGPFHIKYWNVVSYSSIKEDIRPTHHVHNIIKCWTVLMSLNLKGGKRHILILLVIMGS